MKFNPNIAHVMRIIFGSNKFVRAGLMFSGVRQTILRILLILCLIINSTAYQVIQEVSGSVKAGEYSHYKIELTSTLALVLVSDQGDGDLYVSLSEEPPTFELYDYASETCGAEIVILPLTDETARVFAIGGVYGHVRYNTTEYRLYLIKCDVDVEFLDTLKIANDPSLIDTIKKLQFSGKAPGKSNFWTSFGEWIVWLLINGLELGVEVFL